MKRTMVGEDGITYRLCRKCQDVFPLTAEFFYPLKAGSPFFGGMCKKCSSRRKGVKNNPETAKAWKLANPEKVKEYRERARQKSKDSKEQSEA